MPITDPLVLPVDVVITPVGGLPSSIRERMRAESGEYAVTRPRGRSYAKIISAEGARLLEEFREAKRVADAVIGYASRNGLDPDALLVDAFPLLRDCFNGRFLVPAGSPEAASILPTRERGDRIGGFEVLRCIQVLHDSELYQARSRDGTLAAVKLARPGAGRGAALMFGREAAVLEHLEGEGAPELLASGRHRRRPWLALSWCEGVSPEVAFAELRERNTPEGRRGLLRLATAVARSYARLHRRGVLHGDVHPKNLLIGRRGEVTILDFGLARALPPTRLAGKPATGGVAPFYPPEYARAQLAGRALPPPTAASEQYALGALLYHLLTGRSYVDFDLERAPMLRQVVVEPPLPFSTRHVTPWPDLERILARALSKEADDRYPSVTALAGALRKVPRGGAGTPLTAEAGTGSHELVEKFLARVHFSGPDFPLGSDLGVEPPTCSFRFGGAGIAYALYRLACLRDDAETLALADAWLSRTEAACDTPTAFTAPGNSELTSAAQGPISPFHSLPGVHLVRTLVALAMGDLRSARIAATRFVETSRTPWDVLDVELGRAGTLLGCAALLEALPPKTDAAAAEVRRLGDETLAWMWDVLDRLGPIGRSPELEALGVAHGWAGLLYASLRWCRSARRALPPGLSERLAELAACAEPLGRGVHWWPRKNSDAPSVLSGGEIMGWCSGPSGFVHLWTLAHDRLRRPEYLALAEASAWSTWDGRSNHPDLCCGLAGRAYGLLNLYKYTGDSEWLEHARSLALRSAGVFQRAPQASPWPHSLFKGPLGVVLLLADLDRPETACMPLFEPEGWPDPVSPAHA